MDVGHYEVVVQMDWSTSPAKRWMAQAQFQSDGSYLCDNPKQISRPDRLLEEIRHICGPSGCTLVGFDFPIGLPIAYAMPAGISSFLAALQEFGRGALRDFYTTAGSPDEINLKHPFCPARAGGARQSYLVNRLGVNAFDDLRRACEPAHPRRRAASPLFWTLGAQKVGKAAISGWQEVLLENGKLPPYLVIWPFSGEFNELFQAGVSLWLRPIQQSSITTWG